MDPRFTLRLNSEDVLDDLTVDNLLRLYTLIATQLRLLDIDPDSEDLFSLYRKPTDDYCTWHVAI